MNTFEFAQGAHLERVRDIFSEIGSAQALLNAAQTRGGNRRVAASALYAAATNGTGERDHAIQSLLTGNRAARTMYHRVLADSALHVMPEAKAASSTDTVGRHGKDCRIHIERSRAEPSQFFVVVELPSVAGAATPTSLVVCDSQDRCRHFALPPARDGIAQIIADADSDLMRLIGDPTTRVYLT